MSARLRREQRALLGRLAPRLAVVLAVLALLAATVNLWGAIPAWHAGFITGGLAVAPALLVSDLLGSMGFKARQIGGEAERWTTAELRRLGRHWRVIDDVRFEGGNVDHVAIGPDRILVVETKWLGPRRDASWAIGDASRQLSWAAERIRLLLRDLCPRRTIVPMLMLWGPGASLNQSALTGADGLEVVAGRDAKAWRSALTRSVPANGMPDDDAVRVVGEYVTRCTIPDVPVAGSAR